MPTLELPHTAGCLVCGRDNPQGLRLQLHVQAETGRVTTRFTPAVAHIGFEGIIHGGVLATVLDEAMVWSASWTGRRFCVCGEMTVRFRHAASVGEPLTVSAEVRERRGAKLVETSGSITDAVGRTVATASGKYVPLDRGRHEAFVRTFIDEPSTAQAAASLKAG